MPLWKLRAYLDQLPALRAERQLSNIEAAAVPHMDDRGRSTVVREHQRTLRRDRNEPTVRASARDLEAIGIPVIKVPPTSEG